MKGFVVMKFRTLLDTLFGYQKIELYADDNNGMGDRFLFSDIAQNMKIADITAYDNMEVIAILPKDSETLRIFIDY